MKLGALPQMLERGLLVTTPAIALAIVALGLRFGAPETQVAALVYAAPEPLGSQIRALSILVLRQSAGGREPVANARVDVMALRAEGTHHCLETMNGAGVVTNDDGVAACTLPVGPRFEQTRILVLGDGGKLADGLVTDPASDPPAPPDAHWMPAVRREGDVVIDAVMVGDRAAPGFPATLWVRARDRDTRKPVARASIELEGDASFTPPVAKGTTDTRGWASVTVTPLGLAVTPTLRARGRRGGADGAEILGEWVGPFPIAPGAAHVDTRPRWGADEAIEIDLAEPTAWANAYVEVDDARGAVWSTTVRGGVASSDGSVHTGLHVPPLLAAGLYWAVASASPFTDHEGEGRMAYRAFFVAPTDEEALRRGTDIEACTPPVDSREVTRALGPCLALAPEPQVTHRKVLDGFDARDLGARIKRRDGLTIALLGLMLGAVLEGALLLRGATRARVRVREDGEAETVKEVVAAARVWMVVLTLLVAMLGFVLMAAFVFRVS